MDAIERAIQPPMGGSFFLFGPRGTGKSTWLRDIYPGALWVDMLDPGIAREYAARPERLLTVVREARQPGLVVVIDEVQRVPEVLSAVHMLIEEDKSTRFVLTGSSSRKLKRTGVDLLAGRALLATMHPFMACELGNRFALDTALALGMLPLVIADSDPAQRLRTYVAVYINEEVKQEGLVRNTGDFARFTEVVSFSHGCELNTSAIARECAVGRKAVEGYVSILGDLLLSFTVPVFAKRAERAPRAHPKFYYFDAGVYRSVRPRGPLDRPEEIAGAALEGLVAQHLRAWCAYRGEQERLHYWRLPSGSEVDFVVYGAETFCAIEVKNTDRIRTGDFAGLKSFGNHYPQAQRLLLYRGAERTLVDGIHCMPVETFLRGLHPSRSL
jgi:uncharacterized protein